MNKENLNPDDLISLLRGGFTYLELNRSLLDRLNVFPVPDGDTGANMASTLSAGIEALKEPGDSLNDIGKRFNTELNRCSRGNSGFILARFFHGFMEVLENKEYLTAALFTRGISNGSFHVNGALFSPVEGTMISILSAVSSALSSDSPGNMKEALETAVDSASQALFRTPQQLPILARAGVVDSGALGLLFIFRGMYAAFSGSEPVLEEESDYRFEPDPQAGDSEEDVTEYRFCTEAVVLRNGTEDRELEEWLKAMGNSIALVKDEELLKIHIHTNEPKAVFQRLEQLGRLDHTKVDDMLEQSRLVSSDSNENSGVSILAFVPGEGFERIYEDLGISDCFIYGDTLPSPEEISQALENMETEQIIILPNNSNILPSVMAVRKMTGKKISIVPTKNVIQGITASYGFSADDNAADNIESMNGFINDAVALFLYRSTLDTKFGDTHLKKGDWFITRDKDVLGTGDSASEAVRTALKKIEHSGISDVAVYHGDGFDPRDLDSVISSINSVLEDVDIEDHFGGQNRAALIISLE